MPLLSAFWQRALGYLAWRNVPTTVLDTVLKHLRLVAAHLHLCSSCFGKQTRSIRSLSAANPRGGSSAHGQGCQIAYSRRSAFVCRLRNAQGTLGSSRLTGRSGGLRRGVGVDVLHLAGAHDAVKRAARELRSRTEGHALHDAAHDAAHHAAATLLGHGGRSGRRGHGRRWGRSRAAGGRRRRATHRLRRLRDAWCRGGLARGRPRGSGASRGWHAARLSASLGIRSDSVQRGK